MNNTNTNTEPVMIRLYGLGGIGLRLLDRIQYLNILVDPDDPDLFSNSNKGRYLSHLRRFRKWKVGESKIQYARDFLEQIDKLCYSDDMGMFAIDCTDDLAHKREVLESVHIPRIVCGCDSKTAWAIYCPAGKIAPSLPLQEPPQIYSCGGSLLPTQSKRTNRLAANMAYSLIRQYLSGNTDNVRMVYGMVR